jgi:hypothetical protein
MDWTHCQGIFGDLIDPKSTPQGVILATAVVTRVVDIADDAAKSTIPASQLMWFFGPYGWMLTDVQVLKTPIPYKGMLKLWRVDGRTEIEINRQIAALHLEQRHLTDLHLEQR